MAPEYFHETCLHGTHDQTHLKDKNKERNNLPAQHNLSLSCFLHDQIYIADLAPTGVTSLPASECLSSSRIGRAKVQVRIRADWRPQGYQKSQPQPTATTAGHSHGHSHSRSRSHSHSHSHSPIVSSPLSKAAVSGDGACLHC